MEQYREEIRDLVQYLSYVIPHIDTNAKDIVESTDYVQHDLIDIRTYRQKVLDYLTEHTDNVVINKIKNLEPIDANDLKELEDILWHQLGTVDEYKDSTDIDNLAAFVRSIVGIDQDAINLKFGEFLSGNILNSQQQEFVKAIINYVRKNGDIKKEDLIEKSPFDSYNIAALFGTNTKVILNIVDAIHNSIRVA